MASTLLSFSSLGKNINMAHNRQAVASITMFIFTAYFLFSTADGKISRMEMPGDISEEEDSLDKSLESFRSRSRLGLDQGYDINCKLKYVHI